MPTASAHDARPWSASYTDLPPAARDPWGSPARPCVRSQAPDQRGHHAQRPPLLSAPFSRANTLGA
ncbi:hypothetical protein C8R44DRAFT_811053 [Mycena epipterygia]|nr:hypothetical protein C8R44DRAFT_811053 [Mycena epipterygia]